MTDRDAMEQRIALTVLTKLNAVNIYIIISTIIIIIIMVYYATKRSMDTYN